MLIIISRRRREGFTIRLDPSVDPARPVGDLLGDKGIRIYIKSASGAVRLAIGAPDAFAVVRRELERKDSAADTGTEAQAPRPAAKTAPVPGTPFPPGRIDRTPRRPHAAPRNSRRLRNPPDSYGAPGPASSGRRQ